MAISKFNALATDYKTTGFTYSKATYVAGGYAEVGNIVIINFRFRTTGTGAEILGFPLPKFVIGISAYDWNSDASVGMYLSGSNDIGVLRVPVSHAEGGTFTNNQQPKASGQGSHAEGRNSKATGEWSHAEGIATASGEYSHAEVDGTASGWGSHSEGGTASGVRSHSEGYGTASSHASHAEGVHTKASGEASHAEGFSTTASGENSHAGGDRTIAQRLNQTAIGAWNVADTRGSSGSDYGDYIFIIGNGTVADARRNAMTVAWSGDTWIMGTLTQSSDKRLKEHKDYLGDDAVAFIKALKPAHFTKDGADHLGFYAQDVEEEDKWNCMVGEDAMGYKTLGYTEMIAPLVAYCQYLEKRIEKLEKGAKKK